MTIMILRALHGPTIIARITGGRMNPLRRMLLPCLLKAVSTDTSQPTTSTMTSEPLLETPSQSVAEVS